MGISDVQALRALKMARQASSILKGAIPSKNLFNKADITAGYYISSTGGLTAQNLSFPANVSNFIPVTPNTTYTPKSNDGIAFYDSNFAYITGSYTKNVIPVISPANAAYVRVTAMQNIIDTFQLEIGSVATYYAPYTLVPVDASTKINGLYLEDGSVPITKIKEFSASKNLFDKTKAINGYFVNMTNGTLATNISPWFFYASDYMPVQGGAVYAKPDAEQMAFYDSHMNYISGGRLSTPITAPQTAVYARVSVPVTSIDTYQFEKSSASTPYVPFGGNLNFLSSTAQVQPVNIVIPSNIYVAVGRTVEIYNSQIIDSARKDLYLTYVCGVGKQFSKKFQIAATSSNVGVYPLTINVYDYDMNLITSKSVNVEIVTKTLSTTRNILCVGDSLTDIDGWRKEIYNNLAGPMFGTGKINYIGTKGPAPLVHEGMSGWSTSSFLANNNYTYGGNIILTVSNVTTVPQSKKQYTITDDQGSHVWEFEKAVGNQYYFNRITNGTYTMSASGTITQVDSGTIPGDATIAYTAWAWQPGNPFWNTTTSQLDFLNYLSTNSFPNPDVIVFYLGANDLSSKTGNRASLKAGLTTSASNLKTLVDKAQSQLPNAKILIIQIPFWADQNGLAINYTNYDTQNQRGMDLRVFLYNQLLLDTFSSYTNTTVVPLGQTMDRDNAFSPVATVVNPRTTTTEMYSTGGVHPGNNGFLQMADSIFSSLVKMIN